MIVADNLFRDGAALDANRTEIQTRSGSESLPAAQEVAQRDERVHNVLLTIGDGVMLVWRRAAGEL